MAEIGTSNMDEPPIVSRYANLPDTLLPELTYWLPWLIPYLSIAIRNGRHDIVDLLTKMRPSDATEIIKTGDLICAATAHGDYELVAALFEWVPDKQRFFKHQRLQGRNALHVATAKGDVPTMNLFFLAYPEAVGELTDDGETCLHLAAKHKNVPALELAAEWFERPGLEHLANKQDKNGDTVLDLATRCGDSEILRALLCSKMAMRINIRNADGFTAVDLPYRYSNEIDNDIIEPPRTADAFRGAKESNNALSHSSPETRIQLVTLLLGFLALPLQVVINPPEYWLQSTTGPKTIRYYHVKELLLGTSHESRIIYAATISGDIFVLPIIFIPLLVWPLPLRNPLLIALMFVTIFYCLAMAHVLPNFVVLCGPFRVQSYWFMWIMVALGYSAVYILICLVQFTVKKWNKRTRDFCKVATKEIKELDQDAEDPQRPK